MKKRISKLLWPVLALLVGFSTCARAATIYWINSQGSFANLWSWPGNWSPNQVPGTNDVAVVATLVPGGPPAFVNLDVNVAVGGLLLGTNYACTNAIGPDSLRDDGYNITLYGPMVFNECGYFDWIVGNIIGSNANASISGTLDWSAQGSLSGTLTITTNSVLEINNAVFQSDVPELVLTNYGTVYWYGGEGAPLSGGGVPGTALYNYGLWECETDLVMNAAYGGDDMVFNNLGTFRVSGGANGVQIQNGVTFNNSGTVDVQVASLSIQGGGSGTGLYLAEAGTTLAFTGNYTAGRGAALEGSGTNLLDGGTFTLATTSSTSNGVLAGSALQGSNGVVEGRWTWTSGSLGADQNSVLTLGSNAMVTLAGQSGTPYDVYGDLTNAGTLNLASGDFRLRGDYSAQVFNLPGALLNFQADDSVDYFGSIPTFFNSGTVRKSAAAGVSTINPLFVNSGVLDVESGTLALNGGGSFNAGSTIRGPATAKFSGGNFNLNVAISATNVQLAGASITGVSFVSGPGTWTWISGSLGSSASDTLTLATNITLTLAGQNGNEYDILGTLSNSGTMLLTSGDLRLRGDYSAQLINLPGALVNFQADVPIDIYAAATTIYNYGTVRKSAAGGTSTISPGFVNAATLDVRSGTLSLNGGGSGTGLYLAEAGTTLAFGGSSSMTYTASPPAVLTGAGTNLFNGAGFVLETTLSTSNGVLAGGYLAGNGGVVSGLWSWTGGSFGAQNSRLTLASNTVVTLEAPNGSPNDVYGDLTNAGTMLLTSGDLRLRGDYSARLFNQPGALIALQANNSVDVFGGSPTLYNFGTFRKAGGTGTTTVSSFLVNAGTLDAQMGLINIAGGYSLSGSDLNFGINSLNNYGQINLPGTAALTGSVSANLNDGYQPTVGNSFVVLTYGAETGLFTNSFLPLADIWQTNYNPGNFVLTVLGTRPVLIDPMWLGNGHFEFSFNGTSGASNIVLFSTNLSSGIWIPLSTNAGSGSLITITNQVLTNSPRGFYRLEVEP